MDVDVDVKESSYEDRCDLTGGGERGTTSQEVVNVGRRIIMASLQTSNSGRFCKFTLGLTCLTLDVNLGPSNVSGPDSSFVACTKRRGLQLSTGYAQDRAVSHSSLFASICYCRASEVVPHG